MVMDVAVDAADVNVGMADGDGGDETLFGLKDKT